MVSTKSATQSIKGLSSVVLLEVVTATIYGSSQMLTMRIKARSDGLSRNGMMVPTKFSMSISAHFSVAMAKINTAITLAGSKTTATTKTKARSAGASKGILMVPTKFSMPSIKAHFSVAMASKVMATVEYGLRQILIMKIVVKSAGF